MKITKGVYLTLAIILSICLLCGCEDPPIANDHVTDYSSYGSFNRYVNTFMKERGCLMLPSTIPEGTIVNDYEYLYQCSILGDPSFSVFLDIAFSSDECFKTEQQRISDNCCKYLDSSDGFTIFYGSEVENINRYFNDIIEDGMALFTDLAVIYDEGRIIYLYANWQDNAVKNEHFDNVVNLIRMTEDG